MASFNKVILIGNLCADVEVRQAGSVKVATLRLAVNESYKSKSGEKVEQTVFVDADVWDKQAEICGQYLAKGKSVLIEGRLQMDTWDDKETGQKRTKLKVRVDRVQFLSPRGDGEAGTESPQTTSLTDRTGEDSIPF